MFCQHEEYVVIKWEKCKQGLIIRARCKSCKKLLTKKLSADREELFNLLYPDKKGGIV